MTTSTAVDLRGRVFGSADWESYYGSPKPLAEEVEEILQSTCLFHPKKRVFETHFAFVGVPAINGDALTVAKWLQLHPPSGQPKFYFGENPWHAGQPHTDVTVLQPRLYITLCDVVPGSTYKTPEEQVALLPEGYEVPETIEEVTKDILGFRRTGKRFNPNVWAACKERTVQTSQALAGSVSCVGIFDEGGLGVSSWDGSRRGDVGVGASRILKLES
ncbi:hypothetical protein HY311_02375 [Candidatus Nomurabacteria bacterium]|nr:hypothetical protein [Candidatus Nomurabacteria bacterium]